MSPFPMKQHFPILIGIAGKKRTGKNTVANNIAFELEKHGQTCTFIAFAEPLRTISMDFDWSSNQMDEDKDAIHPIWGISWRQFAQTIGSMLRNDFRTDVFLKLMDIRLAEIDKSYDFAIITDIRLQNEADYVKNKGGIVFNVMRETKLVDNHETEKGINKWDYTIWNNRTEDDLMKDCIIAAKSIMDIYNAAQTIAGRPNNVK